jgi:hypothetical protein
LIIGLIGRPAWPLYLRCALGGVSERDPLPRRPPPDSVAPSLVPLRRRCTLFSFGRLPPEHLGRDVRTASMSHQEKSAGDKGALKFLCVFV